MLTRFITHIQQQHLFPLGQQVLLAVSGGIDSVVLAHLMHRAGCPFAIAHCNFHLRPGDCDRDEQFVCTLAERYRVPIHVAQFSTRDYASAHHLCIEDAARQLRYDYFEQLRQQHHYAAILTAHHRDDAAETFFINLLRGTGLAGLHGILPVQGHIVRPLLPFGRDEIESYAAQHQLPHVEDSTNASLQYRRNQIRHQVIPLLRQIQPAADSALQNTIAHLQSVEGLYNTLLQPLRHQCVEEQPGGCATITLSFANSPHANQLLYEFLKPYAFNGAVVSQILSASQPGKTFRSVTHEAVLDRGRLLISPLHQSDGGQPEATFHCEVSRNFDYFALDLRHLPSGMAVFDADKVVLPLNLRHWQEGDTFRPLGMDGKSQLVSDFFTDHKYSLPQKKAQLLLVDAAGEIIWIVGRRTTHPHRVTPQTCSLLTVRLVGFPKES